MKNRGFTLIELLAVIVILAIIALIATPIVINIINDAKYSSDERSVEFYGDAVEKAIVRAKMKGIPISRRYTSSDDGKTLTPSDATDNNRDLVVDYSGSKVKCSTVVSDQQGLYLARCTVGTGTKEYKYGEYQQVYKPQYYHWTDSWVQSEISAGLPEDNIDTDVSNIEIPNNYPFYLAFDSTDGTTIDAAYVCFVRNNKEYCLKGNDPEAHETNRGVIAEAYEEVKDTEACEEVNNHYRCEDDDEFLVNSSTGGGVYVGYANRACLISKYDKDADYMCVR